MSLSDIAKPRKAVLSGEGVEGIIDLENLRDPKKRRLEARPDEFFALTYPTSDVRFVLQNLHERFSSGRRSAGLYLFEGYKGSGKSHLLLLIHHLAESRQAGQQWLASHQLECNLPDGLLVITHKFTDFPLDSIWGLLWERCGAGTWAKEQPPNLDEVRAVLDGRKVLLILDELERGIQSIPDPARQTQNLNFLQMLSEESQRDEAASITLFASIYDSAREPGSTLKRVPRIDVKFANQDDRTQIVLHRLFENAGAFDRNLVETVVASFRNEWKRKGYAPSAEYLDRLKQTYPFSPELIELIQEQARDQFQGTRGALGLLGVLVKLAHRKADLITTATASLAERSVANRLIDLDPGQKIINCAQSDLNDLRDQPLAGEIAASVLLATLAASGKLRGMAEDTLARQVLKPGDDVNVFHSTLQAFHKFGTYFHEQEGLCYFDPEEKPGAKVEYKSLGIDPRKALNKVLEFWAAEWFGNREATVFRDVDQAQAQLRLLDSRRPRYVLAPRRLSSHERHALYFGLENRNLVILLEPRQKDFNALTQPDILKWAQRHLAALDLQSSTTKADRRRQFERIAAEDKAYIQKAFKNAGLAYVLVEEYGERPEDDQVELEPLGNATACREVAEKLARDFFPVQRFTEHLRDRLNDWIGRRVRNVEKVYQETLGYPVPIFAHLLRDALIELCKNRELSLRHEKDQACGRKPALNDAEFAEAVIEEPFEPAPVTPPLNLGGDAGGGTTPETPPTQPGGTAQGGGEEGGQPPTEPTGAPLEHVETPFVEGLGALRQEVAARLAGHEDHPIRQVTFRLFLETRGTDLGSMPAGLRGSLSGMGDLTADLTLTRQGDFSKADIEQMAESLPALQDAEYKAEMKVQLSSPESVS